MTRTAILIVSVDEADRLARSLPAALAQPGAEVVVVDNACTDRTRSLCEEHGVRVVALQERVSYAAAVNRAITETSAPEVLLLNADCVLDGGFLDAARAPLAEPGVGSVAPRLVRATGMEPHERLDELDAVGMSLDRRRKNGLVGHGEPAEAYMSPGPAFGADGACALYRRAVLDAVAVGSEVLDEDLALWASDADLAWRAQLAGWGCRYEPAAVAWHVRFYAPSTRAAVAAEHRRLQFRNRLLMMMKNDTWRTRLPDLPWIAGYEVLALGHALLRERELLPAYRDALRLRPAMRARRRASRARAPFGLTPPRGR